MDETAVNNMIKDMHQMQQNEIINELFNSDIWFTTKQDPTYMEPSSYYELDEYGYPTEKSLQQMEKDCEDYVGDGAIDFKEAVKMWIEKSLAEGKIAYKDYLVTKFKDKPVVDDIQAYEVKTENKELNESEFANEDLLNDFTQYVANNAVELKDGLYEIEVPKELGYEPVLNTDMLKKAYMKVKKLFNLDNGDTSIIFESKKVETNLNESVKTRLKEENTKSLNLISQMFQNEDFDANSNEGKIVVKTSTLFNTLSDKGYDVQVGFDNGDSQSTILLGQQGGSVNITITDATKPLQAFTSGSIELNDDNLKVLQDITEIIQNIE